MAVFIRVSAIRTGINKGLGISRSLSSTDLAHDVMHLPDITQPLVMFERQSYEKMAPIE
jgi:hypothetical protein